MSKLIAYFLKYLFRYYYAPLKFLRFVNRHTWRNIYWQYGIYDNLLPEVGQCDLNIGINILIPVWIQMHIATVTKPVFVYPLRILTKRNQMFEDSVFEEIVRI